MRLSQSPADLVLRGRVLTPAGEQPGAVVVAGGRIRAVEPPAVPVAAARVVEAARGWIAPGFIDVQVNGALGHDFGVEPAAVAAVARWLPRTGVTAFLPTLVTAPLPRLTAALACLGAIEPAASAAVPLGVHLEGPYLNPAYRGAHAAEWLRPLALPELDELCAAGPVRLLTLAPELPGAPAAIAWLRARGIVVSAGHSGADHATTLAAVAAGLTCGTHLFNAMAPFHHRAPGLVGALLTEPGLRAGLIADGIHVHPAVLALAYRARGADGLALVTDGMAALGMGEGRFTLGGRPVEVRAGAARLADGTLAGGVVPIDAALRGLVAATGCSVAEAVRMATATPAEILGLSDRGRIAPGARADLVVLDPDLRVRLTVVAGRVVWEAPASGAAASQAARHA